MEQDRLSRIRHFCQSPLVNGAGVLIGLLGIGFSLFSHLATMRHRDLVITANAGVVIVDKTSAGKLTVLADGKRVVGGVSSVTIFLWNSGRESIKSQNVLQPVEISFPQGNRIIEARRAAVSRSVTDISLDRTGLEQGRVGVRWNILEANDGAAIQLIFEGHPTDRPSVHGIIEGQGEIRALPRVRDRAFGWGAPLWFLSCLALIVLSVKFWRGTSNLKMPELRYVSFGMLLFAILGIWFLASSAKTELNLPTVPPWLLR